jgi:hypothetical protein
MSEGVGVEGRKENYASGFGIRMLWIAQNKECLCCKPSKSKI